MTTNTKTNEQPAGCTLCNHPLYAGMKCKNCGRVTEQPAGERAELIRLADEYAEELAKFQMEDIYGTSKTYTENCKEEADEARQALITALLEAYAQRSGVKAF